MPVSSAYPRPNTHTHIMAPVPPRLRATTLKGNNWFSLKQTFRDLEFQMTLHFTVSLVEHTFSPKEISVAKNLYGIHQRNILPELGSYLLGPPLGIEWKF